MKWENHPLPYQKKIEYIREKGKKERGGTSTQYNFLLQSLKKKGRMKCVCM
jgi:hypothetical protein